MKIKSGHKNVEHRSPGCLQVHRKAIFAMLVGVVGIAALPFISSLLKKKNTQAGFVVMHTVL